MDYDRRDYLVHRIITGYTPVISFGKVYKIYDPTAESKYLAELYVESVTDDYFDMTMLNSEAVNKILIEKEIWNIKWDKELEANEKEQKNLLLSIARCQFKSIEKQRLQGLLEGLKRREKDLSNKKNSLNSNTIEYLCKVEKFKYLLFCNTYDIKGNRVWVDWSEFENNISDSFIKNLLTKSYFAESLDESEFRELARTEPWRTYWRTGCKSGGLFKHAACEMTDYQRTLVSWSLLYDNVFESVDCPEDDIINNDVLLDAWLIDQQEKRKSESKNVDFTNNAKIKNSQEIGIVVDSLEDAQKVYNLNSDAGKRIIAGRENMLLRKGQANDTELPDIKQDITIAKNQAAVASMNKKA